MVPFYLLCLLLPRSSNAQEATCSSGCESFFLECLEDVQGNPYATCRRLIDANDGEFVSAGCVAACTGTAAMVAGEEGSDEEGGFEEGEGAEGGEESGDDQAVLCDNTTSVQFGPLVFAANLLGDAQLAPCSLCEAWSARSDCEVRLDIPSACSGESGKGCPAVFLFHGGGGEIEAYYGGDAATQLHQVAENDRAMIGIYVQGQTGGFGPGWTGGESSTEGRDTSSVADDLGFIHYIINSFLRERYSWDSRLYAHGFSSGAALTQRIAANGRLGFSAVSVVATQLLSAPARGGPPPLNWNRPGAESCARPLGVISFHGTADDVIPYEGSASGLGEEEEEDTGDGFLDSVDASMVTWAMNNNCNMPQEYSSDTSRQGEMNAEEWEEGEEGDNESGGESASAVGFTGETTHTFAVEHHTWAGCDMPTENYKIVNFGHDQAELLQIGGQTVIALAIQFFRGVDSEQCPNVCPKPFAEGAAAECSEELEIQPQVSSRSSDENDPSGEGGRADEDTTGGGADAVGNATASGAAMSVLFGYVVPGWCLLLLLPHFAV